MTCGTFFGDTPQFVCESYDHIEIPQIAPHVTRVSLLGRTCPCCAKRFTAPAPQDMPKGSPFGPNLRALVIYLRFTQGITFECLSILLFNHPWRRHRAWLLHRIDRLTLPPSEKFGAPNQRHHAMAGAKTPPDI
jgi:hypothetical protein